MCITFVRCLKLENLTHLTTIWRHCMTHWAGWLLVWLLGAGMPYLQGDQCQLSSCGKNLHSLLNSLQLGPELLNAIPTPTWLLQTDIHSFPGIEPIKAQLSFSCECLQEMSTNHLASFISQDGTCSFPIQNGRSWKSILIWLYPNFGLWVFKTKQEIIMITDTHMSYSDLDISEKTQKIQNFYWN